MLILDQTSCFLGSSILKFHNKTDIKYLYVLFFAGRACWSLGNAHSSMGQHLEAYQYAKRHLEISRDTKDRMGQATAQLNLADLCRYVNFLTLSACF